jgi:hypothetical protein
MAPWLIFMFVGAMDWGFYAYALIATESAARVACLYTSTSTADATDSTTACNYAVGQLKRMPNVGTSCATSLGALSTTNPVYVSATYVASGADTNAAAQVSVTYLTPIMIPMFLSKGSATPTLPGQVTITRTVQMRIRG